MCGLGSRGMPSGTEQSRIPTPAEPKRALSARTYLPFRLLQMPASLITAARANCRHYQCLEHKKVWLVCRRKWGQEHAVRVTDATSCCTITYPS